MCIRDRFRRMKTSTAILSPNFGSGSGFRQVWTRLKFRKSATFPFDKFHGTVRFSNNFRKFFGRTVFCWICSLDKWAVTWRLDIKRCSAVHTPNIWKNYNWDNLRIHSKTVSMVRKSEIFYFQNYRTLLSLSQLANHYVWWQFPMNAIRYSRCKKWKEHHFQCKWTMKDVGR